MISNNVCNIIVENNLCIGCGVCAGICPSKTLEMTLSSFGEFNPVDTEHKCLSSCNLCLTSCPFWNQDKNEDAIGLELFSDRDGIKHTKETGYYFNSFIGFSKVASHRTNGSSGGKATWLLEKLLVDHLVDYVICVRPVENDDLYFKFDVFTNSLDVRKSSRSSYYPNELSDVIKYVLNHPGKYAVTGLPCYLKALRLASIKIPKLRARIIYYIGLACGQLPSAHFVDYMAAKMGINASNISKVQFRVKDQKRSYKDFGLAVEYQDGGEKNQKVIYWSEGMGKIWTYGYFKHNACNYCDDIFAELADVVFMDAWLKGYSEQSDGFSIALIRNREIEKLFIEGSAASELSSQGIAITEVIKSQESALVKKRADLSDRLKLIEKDDYVPQKRVSPSKQVKTMTKFQFWLTDTMRDRVRRNFTPRDSIRSFRTSERSIFLARFFYRIVVAINKRLLSR